MQRIAFALLRDEQGIAEVINPATEEIAGSVPLGDERDVDAAVAAARKAFANWSRTPSSVRASYIRALAEQLRSRADEMAAVITAELGMPVQWCRAVQVEGPIAGLEQYVELAGLMDEVREVGNSLVIREAVGVCAFINPWNYPLHQLIAGLLGIFCAVWMQRLEISTTNVQTFSEVVFKLTMTPAVGVQVLLFSLVMGAVGGLLPAYRASRMEIVDALRNG